MTSSSLDFGLLFTKAQNHLSGTIPSELSLLSNVAEIILGRSKSNGQGSALDSTILSHLDKRLVSVYLLFRHSPTTTTNKIYKTDKGNFKDELMNIYLKTDIENNFDEEIN